MVIQQKNTSISDKIITYIIIQPDDLTEGSTDRDYSWFYTREIVADVTYTRKKKQQMKRIKYITHIIIWNNSKKYMN